jgi:hypothetical protein
VSPEVICLAASALVLAATTSAWPHFYRAVAANADKRWLDDNREAIQVATNWGFSSWVRQWDIGATGWALGVLVGAGGLAAADFSLLFVVIFAGCLAAALTYRDAMSLWNQRLNEQESLGPPTTRTRQFASAFAALTFLSTFAFLALMACVGFGGYELIA